MYVEILHRLRDAEGRKRLGKWARNSGQFWTTSRACPSVVGGQKVRFQAKYDDFEAKKKTKLNSMVLVRVRTIPTERPPLFDEVIANFYG
jgi:hypothetical protein